MEEKKTQSDQLDQSFSITVVSDDSALEQPPGTRLLIDTKNVTSGQKQEVVLIPHPSNDPEDPLNWSRFRKYKAMGIMMLWTMLTGSAILTPNVTYGAVIMEFGFTIDYLNVGAALSILVLGVGNLFFNPIALKYGRRLVYLFSAVVSTAALVVMATSKNKAVQTGGRILLGFSASPFEQLPAVTVGDLFFVHERGWGLSLYLFAITTGSLLGPTAAGFVIQSMGWRWMYWFQAIFMGVTAIIVFLFFEETGFDRPNSNSGDEEATGQFASGKSIGSKLRLVHNFRQQKNLLSTILGPFRFVFDPIVCWSGLLYGFGIAWLSVMATTAFSTFQGPVYNFTFGQLGLTNLAPLIGAYISLWIGGSGTDKFMLWKAARNGGIMEAESRIYVCFIAGPIMSFGLLLYGIGAYYSIHWIGPVIGMGFIGAGIPLSGEVALGYVSESYPLLTGETTTAVIFIRNLIGCGMTFAINPWIVRSGMRNTFIVIGVLAFVMFYSGAFFIWKGKDCRRRAAKMYRSMTSHHG